MNIATSYVENPISAYGDIFEQFADNASFLWILRSIAVEQPHYSVSDIRELEQRIDAQLDGLMTSIEQSWQSCLQGLELGEPGEVFTAAALAFRSHDVKKIQTVIEAGLGSSESEKGLISALGWLPAKLVHSWVEKFLSSKDLNHKYLAIAGCSVRRENPGEALTRIVQRDDCKQHAKLYCRSLRLIGEIRRQDLMPTIDEAVAEDDEEVGFWSNWSAVLLGKHDAVNRLKPHIFKAGAHQQKVMDIVFRSLPVEQGRQWIAELGQDSEQARAVIKATGVLGDPHAVNWLISKMEQPEVSKLAGEAFSNITGIDLVRNELTSESPPKLASQPNDDPGDDNIELDEDENLPWPDVDKVKTIWVNHGRNFIAGKRYFMGREITPEFLKDKLINANQRQRHAAAMELALIDSNMPLQNTRARVGL
ncbi:MAG: TIGR02270 family protein [Aestuariibacter sp.]|nr:TIGR02270 family protein [Aestuariibacter sp.]